MDRALGPCWYHIMVLSASTLGWAMPSCNPWWTHSTTGRELPSPYGRSFKWRAEGVRGSKTRTQWIRWPLREIKVFRSEVGGGSGRWWFKPPPLKRKRQEQSHYQSYRRQVPFSFSCFLFQSPLLHPPPLSLHSIMNCIQCVVLQPRGLHFHIDGLWGKLGNWILLSWFFFL